MDDFGSFRDVRIENVTGRLYPGLGSGPHPGVLVLHGSGGAGGYEREYARHLAHHGYAAFCVEYFGAPGVPDVLAEIPLSYFEGAAEWLLDQPNTAGDSVGVVGFSRGGEAALLVGAHTDRVGAVVAYVTSCYAFPAPTWMDGIDEECAAWTRDGEPIPYLPVDEHAPESQNGLDEALGADAPNASVRAIEAASADQLAEATIPVERIDGPVCLVSGGADEAWPSSSFAERVVDRLEAHDHPWPYEHVSHPEAGHAIRVPYRFDEGESLGDEHWLGGTNEANARASAEAWQRALEYLHTALVETLHERRKV